MTDVLIARHGQSEWNALGRWQGQADPPLSTLGRLQAAHAATRLSDIDVIVASDLERASDTARIIADALGVDEVVIDADFRERHAGEWQGLTKDDIEATWPGYLADRRRPPGFESDEALAARTDAALRRVLAEHTSRRVLVVSHGGVIYRREQMLGAPMERIPNLGGRWFHHRPVDGRPHEVEHFALGERVVLVGEDEVTVPSQL
jgi:probable phosphoglycerate mutase